MKTAPTFAFLAAAFPLTLLLSGLSATPAQAQFFDQETKLTASDAAVFDVFGISVSISGNTALVGASGDDDRGFRTGSAYLFDITTGNQLAKLTASDATADDRFGKSVAISGNTALVGVSGDDDAGRSSGSAYLFDVTTGNQLAKLTASDAAANDAFGISVSISGNTALVRLGLPVRHHHRQPARQAHRFRRCSGRRVRQVRVDQRQHGPGRGV